MEVVQGAFATTDRRDEPQAPCRGLTEKKKGHTMKTVIYQPMSRVTIYIPDDLHFKLMKMQNLTGLTFSSLCQNAFNAYLAQKHEDQKNEALRKHDQ